MLVFITPKLESKRIPYSYRARATIPSSNISDSRVTDDINSVKPDDIAVLGKKHSKEDAEYLISKEINNMIQKNIFKPEFSVFIFTVALKAVVLLLQGEWIDLLYYFFHLKVFQFH